MFFQIVPPKCELLYTISHKGRNGIGIRHIIDEIDVKSGVAMNEKGAQVITCAPKK